MSHVATELKALLEETETTPKELADLVGLSASYIYNITSGRKPLGAGSLESFIEVWPSTAHGNRLLAAHLKDEIMRAGRDPKDFVIEAKALGRQRTADDDLAIIDEHLEEGDGLRVLIQRMAQMCLESETAEPIQSEESSRLYPESTHPGAYLVAEEPLPRIKPELTTPPAQKEKLRAPTRS